MVMQMCVHKALECMHIGFPKLVCMCECVSMCAYACVVYTEVCVVRGCTHGCT